MSERACPYEAAVEESARTGDWENGLRAHVRECAACSESVRVAEWIGDIATYFGRDQSPLDPTYIWLRAEIERRAKVEISVSWSRLGVLALLGLAVGLVSAAAMLAVVPIASAIAFVMIDWISTAYAEASPIDRTVIGTVWLGLPVLLTAIYLLVLRPLR